MDKINKVAIIGAGALGVMYGWNLTKKLGKDRVFMIADENRINRYTGEGIFCNDERCDFCFIDGSKNSEEKVDLIIFATKFTSLDTAIKEAQNFIHEDTILISVLNGIESEKLMREVFGTDHLLYCMVYGMDSYREGNHVHYKRIGTVSFGDKSNKITHDVKLVEEFLDEAEIKCEIPKDIIHELWSKLMLNCGVNQVAAIYNTGYGSLQVQGEKRQMMIDVMKEVKEVAKYEGIVLTEDEIKEWLMILDKLNPNGMPSLVQDLRAGRKTEVELFSGSIRKLGKKHEIVTPLNDFLYNKIKEMEG
ncbi:MAG: ketopantoate reductase family protein [Oscillospiraceae bacterium]|nr:ketopantoate reductase family protein [Oscillospiraceae bacterium]